MTEQTEQEDEPQIRIVTKFDFELSNAEIGRIYQVYNECFYDSKIISNKLVKKAHDLIGKQHVWKWYLAYLQPNQNQPHKSEAQELIGIAGYVYDTSNISNLDLTINAGLGENICNLGTKKKYRKRGVATYLMEEIIKDPEMSNKDLVVEVIIGSPRYQSLMKLYTKLGFVALSQTDHQRYLILPRSKTTIDKLAIKTEIEKKVALFQQTQTKNV